MQGDKELVGVLKGFDEYVSIVLEIFESSASAVWTGCSECLTAARQTWSWKTSLSCASLRSLLRWRGTCWRVGSFAPNDLCVHVLKRA
jgi:hypothetical protein